jgi:hypothetical protein
MRSLLLFALLCAGCTPVLVRQSSLVPAATLPPTPIESRGADIYFGDSTVSFLDKPELAPNADAGLWIPRTQLEAAISLRMSRLVSIRLCWLDGLSEGAIRASPTTLDNPDANTFGVGPGVVFHGRLPDQPVSMLLAFDTVVVNIPTLVFVESDPADRHDELVTIWSVTMTGAYHIDEGIRLLASVGIRNHPTNAAERIDTDIGAKVESGPANVLVGIGAELQVTEGLSFVPQVQWPVTADPIRYGPIIGLGIRGRFGPDRI